LSGCLRPVHDDLQSLQPLEPAGYLDRYLLRVDRIDRHGRNGGDRLHTHQGSSFGGWRKRGAFHHAIGRSRGGRTTKIHALTDDRGRPLAFQLTPGNTHDLNGARALLALLPCPTRLIADRAYDARSLRDWLAERGAEAVIPPNPTRKHPHAYDALVYRSRNLIERMFCRLKDFRRIATRYDKPARNFLAGVLIAAAITWWTN
jgi:transposase